ncbi:MAG: efflux RND transporter periplasmic adaptor subunit [Clostridiaceae bacterium]|nr:efflux RND transporter periplasmic adaptor subunit [Clostridiaceae bacterium]
MASVVAVVGLAGCQPEDHTARDPRQADRLVVVTTVAASVPVTGQYTGIVGARIQSDLGFRVQGKIVERMVDTGQMVKKGQPLMRIDPTDYTHALDAQAGNVAAARAHWIQADADERRYSRLVITGAASRSAYDQAKAAADSAKAQLDAAVAQERVAQTQARSAVLWAAAEGPARETRGDPGQAVTAGQLGVRLAHAGAREAIVNLPETVRPAIGSTAKANLYGDSVQVAAHLRQLSDAADPRTRTFEARYVMEGDGARAPLGATVTVRPESDQVGTPLSVPLGAIDDEGHGPGVWVIDTKTSKVSYRSVQIRSLGAEAVEIRGDLASGDTIVATGGHYLHDGEQVRQTTIQAAMQ